MHVYTNRHYAGLALLKLADNFENHLKIAEEGGIQALLRLGRAQTSDEQIQYKAALAVGQLASNAVKLLPSTTSELQGSGIGHGARMMGKIRPSSDRGHPSSSAAARGRQLTQEYLESAALATSTVPTLTITEGKEDFEGSNSKL